MTRPNPGDFQHVWFDHAGARLYAAHRGTGRAIICLHGGLASQLSCRPYALPLSEHYHLITPDLRGSDQSVYGGPLSWDQLADDIAALAAHLGVTRAVIAGSSFGAAVAVRVALRHPHLLDGLVLLQPAYGGAELGLNAAQLAAFAAMDAAGRRTLTEGIAALLPLFDALPPEIRDHARAAAARYDPASVATTTQLLASHTQPFSSPSELAAITAPALVVPGVDPTHPVEVADVFARHLPRCAVRSFPPGDFMSMFANFQAAIADFVAGL